MSKKKDTLPIAPEDIKEGVEKSVKGIRKIIKEFKDFAMRGNMIDMAVGIVMGTAFSVMVKSIVENTLIPAILYFFGGAELEDLAYHKILYGQTISDIINFFILAAVVFLVVKTMNAIASINDSRNREEPDPDPNPEIELLKEIRDLLKEDKAS